MSPASLKSFFDPASVAIVGASGDPARIGGRPLRYLLEAGFRGRIYPINPRHDTLMGLPCFASAEDLPEVPETVIVIVPAEQVPATLESYANRGTRAAIVFSSGFVESGPEGAARQEALVELRRRTGLRILGPNCLGAFDAHSGFFGTFTQAFDSGVMPAGALGVVSQSGAAAAHLAYLCRQRGIGIGQWITTGNEADVALEEAIEWMAGSPAVKVIAVFAEAVRNGPAFRRALRAARNAGKPVIVLKVGRSSVGAAAAVSHTGALAGTDAVTDAAIRQFGAVRVDGFDDLLDAAGACLQGRLPSRPTLGIVTGSGGLGILTADAAAALGLEVPALPAASQDRIRDFLPHAGLRNPIDVTAQAVNDPALFGRCLDIALHDGGYGACIIILSSLPAAPALNARLRPVLAALRQDHPDAPILLAMAAPPDIAESYRALGFLVVEDLNRATRLVATLARVRTVLDAPEEDFDGPAPPRLKTADLLGEFDEFTAKRLLSAIGIPVPAEHLVAGPAEAAEAFTKIGGGPAVLKIVSSDIPHKTELGGVVLNIASAEAMAREAAAMLARIAAARPAARIAGLLVSPMLAGDGVEAICGVRRDPVFGPVVMFGLGGIHVEVLKDVSFRIAPFGLRTARQMIDELRGAALFGGVRGAAPADVEAAARALSALSRFAAANADTIAEIEISPLRVLPQGRGVVALDALIEAGETGDL